MNDSLEIQCAFCGEVFEIPLDGPAQNQSFTVDCENCCRPLYVKIQAEDGEILGLDISEG